MFATHFLEWWFQGAWRRIGWNADNPRSVDDLVKHARALVVSDKAQGKTGFYRLITSSHLADAPPNVVQEWSTT